MLIIPELQKVVIMPPRSGSTALKEAILNTYEHAYSPYRHGEWDMLVYIADKEPRVRLWDVVYMLRNPMERMISLWNYMQDVSPERNPKAPQEWIDRVKSDASVPFGWWLRTSTELFNESRTSPIDKSPRSYYCTYYQVAAARKDARYFLGGMRGLHNKGQLHVLNVNDEHKYMPLLGINRPDRLNESTKREATWDTEEQRHIKEHFHTDLILETL